MSQSDRIARPLCFGAYTRADRTDRGCATCMSFAECIQSSVDLSAVESKPARSKYHREIKPGVFVDVYDVLQAFDVRNSALQHVIKKALAAGQRGHKDRATDMAEIVQSAIRAQELES